MINTNTSTLSYRNIAVGLVGSLLLFTLASFTIQPNMDDFFVGKWDVLVVGTPQGDSNMELELERMDGELQGKIGTEEMGWNELTKVEESDESITVYFVGQGYNVYLFLEKTEDDKAEGHMMDMFDASAVRQTDK